MSGRLIGIARRDRTRAAMEVVDRGEISPGEGVRGDFRGALKPGRNQREVTVLAREDWDAAVELVGRPELEWWNRRANLLVEGMALPRTKGATIRLAGGAVLEVTGQTDPCFRMDEIVDGLQAALTPEWRGGVTTRVLAGGPIAVGDPVECGE